MFEYSYDHSLITIIVVLVGLIFGSFVTAASYRIPLRKGFVFGRSKCPSCKTPLSALDLIPVFSWLASGGKCRHCGKAVGWKYPAIEMSTAIVFLIIYQKFGLSYEALIIAIFSVCLMIMVVIDFEHYIIPDGLNLTMFCLAATYMLLGDARLQQFIAGPLLGLGIGLGLRWLIFLWKRREGLGMGDVKFMAVAGLFLTPELIITFLFLSGVIGIIISVLWKILGKGEEFPFGPALAASLFICILAPEFHDLWSNAIGSLAINIIK